MSVRHNASVIDQVIYYSKLHRDDFCIFILSIYICILHGKNSSTEPQKNTQKHVFLGLTSRIQLAPHARRRAVPMTESWWIPIPVLCVNDEVANGGGTGITNAYTDDMLSRERTIMDCIMHRSLGDNTIY